MGRGSSSYLPGYGWLLIGSLGHQDLSVLPSAEHWTTLREQFFEFFLVEMNNQVFEHNGLKTLIVALHTAFLLRQKTDFPSGVAILFFIDSQKGKLTKKRVKERNYK